MHRIAPRMLIASALLAGSALPAWADSIDGNWCAPEGGKHLTIEGPRIRTPGGKDMTGQYGRHDFSYVAPDGDPAPGTAIDMRLMGEHAVRVTEWGGASSVWHRCPPGIS